MAKLLKEYDHPYYCSDSNFYKNNKESFSTFNDFYEEWIDADIDMNLIFRFDVHNQDDGSSYAEFFVMLQRKGIFLPIVVEEFKDSDEEKARVLLQKHWEKIKKIWEPISGK